MQKHIDVVFSIGGELYLAGHFDVDASVGDEALRQTIATHLHRLAWAFESDAAPVPGFSPDEETGVTDLSEAGVEDFGDNPSTPNPRKVLTPGGLVFYEVTPGEFAGGQTWSDALQSYGRGLSYSEQQVRSRFPGSLWENL